MSPIDELEADEPAEWNKKDRLDERHVRRTCRSRQRSWKFD
jgi:hypothetical protein